MLGANSYHFKVLTFGCKVNTYDSGLIEKQLLESIHRNQDAKRMVYILNSCAVTSEATREAEKVSNRLKRDNPQSIVVVTGCGAQVDGSTFDHLPSVDLVVANSHKGQLVDIIDQFLKGGAERVHRSNIFLKQDLEAGGGIESGHTRAFVKIQDGCNSFCTYCVIPFARGRSRSIPIAALVKRISELNAQGRLEVVLTGVHIADYDDNGKDLCDLLEAILRETRIERLRLSSLEPRELSERMLDLYSDQRLCPHFHLSLQSVLTKTLRAMRRRYEESDVEHILYQLQQRLPGAFVGADMIVGFPGESEVDFADSYARLAQMPWTRLHVFPYSERAGTKAVSLPDPVPVHVRRLRSDQLRTLSNDRVYHEALKQVGQVKSVMLLKEKFQLRRGLSRDYWKFNLQNITQSSAAELQVKVLGVEQGIQSDPVLRGDVLQ